MDEYIQGELQYEGGLPYPPYVLHILDASGVVHDLITEPLPRINDNPDPEYITLVASNALFSVGKTPDSLMRRHEVAVTLGVAEEEVEQMVQAGTLPQAKNGLFWNAGEIVVKALSN